MRGDQGKHHHLKRVKVTPAVYKLKAAQEPAVQLPLLTGMLVSETLRLLPWVALRESELKSR